MEEKTCSSFICFNEEVKDGNGGTACMIVRFEDMDLPNEKIAEVRGILGEATKKLRDLLGL